MVQRLFQPIGYQNVDLGDRARKLEPFIDGFYSREGKRSRQQLQDFIKQLPGPLGGRGLDTNVAAKMAAHYNQREAIRAASLKDPFLTVREAQILPLSITKQSETFSYRVGVSYTDINNQPATKFITLLTDVPYDDIGFEARVISQLDEGGKAGRYKERQFGSRPDIEVLDGNRRNPDL